MVMENPFTAPRRRMGTLLFVNRNTHVNAHTLAPFLNSENNTIAAKRWRDIECYHRHATGRKEAQALYIPTHRLERRSRGGKLP